MAVIANVSPITRRVPMTTKTKKKPQPSSARRRKPETNGQPPAEMDADRLGEAKRWRTHGEAARLKFEEAKAEHALAKAEYSIAIAKRNGLISASIDIKEVQEAQREVHNAALRKAKKKLLLDSAKDELKGCEEHLAKSMTETFPLFGEAKQETNGAAE